ncbi:MAG TPA: TIGR02453 family protein [Flavobacteriales bacterium]|nr:DUF2461 domain-containing protein [Flavobacteriales bacterium]HAW20535.1 TIGR02453 family protein [Flavobacteriales bacterium]
MAWFQPSFESFFTDLKKNNNRDWFLANKNRYEENVKKPFEEFVAQMIERMQAYDPECRIQPKDAIFRIYRDVRFSKDKTPYKTQVSAIIGRGGRKEMAVAGMYLELGEKHARVYGGVYQPNKEQLHAIRQEILYNTQGFKSLVNDNEFKKYFGEIRGEKNKRLPSEFVEIQEEQPLIANKQFYYYSDLDPSEIIGDTLIDEMFRRYEASARMRQFLHAPLND